MKRLLIGIVTITTLALTPVAAMAHGHHGNGNYNVCSHGTNWNDCNVCSDYSNGYHHNGYHY